MGEFEVAAGASGSFSVYATAGQYKRLTVRFIGENSGIYGSASDVFSYNINLVNPTVAQNPMSGPPGTSFTQWGTGFTPSSTAVLHVSKPDGTEYPPQNQAIGADGTFSITYTAATNKPTGNYNWWAVDGPTGKPSNTVTYSITVNPTVAQNPMSGPPGTSFAQWGTGFTPSSTAVLHVSKPDGTEYPPQNQAIGADGTFSITYTAPTNKPPGNYNWWAVDGPTGKPSNTVTYSITATAALTLTRINTTGSGSVRSVPAGINCGTTCVGYFAPGTTVTLTATPAAGSVFGGWGGACSGNATTCTLTLDTNKNVSATFVTATPWQSVTPRKNLRFVALDSPPATHALVMTHGWNASAPGWVLDLATSYCSELTGDGYISSLINVTADAIQQVCHTDEWDVWVLDWRTEAGTTMPKEAWDHAVSIGDSLAYYVSAYGYPYVHLIAHSAGSHLIERATARLKDDSPVTAVHETFLDAYDPEAENEYLPGLSSSDPYWGRHFSKYGQSADWADNYVDTRPLLSWEIVGHPFDVTDLHLWNGYNIDVTPGADGCLLLPDLHLGWDLQFHDERDQCRHSRPVRFYQKSQNPLYPDPGMDEAERVDPVAATAGMGFPLSLERGKSLSELRSQYPNDHECKVSGGNCDPIVVTHPLQSSTLSVNATATKGPTSGSALCITADCKAIGLGQPLGLAIPAEAGTLASPGERLATLMSALAKPAVAPTDAPSWLVLQVDTAESVDTLSFHWQFVPGGEGMLQVFVNENWVGSLDQRFLPDTSTQPEQMFVGKLPPGSYEIAVRLDGYGTNHSGIGIGGIGLSRRQLVSAAAGTQMLNVQVYGGGTVTANPGAIACSGACADSYATGKTVTLTATPAPGMQFAGWSGACSGAAGCAGLMRTARSVQATFLPTLFTGMLPGDAGAGNVAVSAGWTLAPLGSGPSQTDGFIALSGDAKSPPDAAPGAYTYPYSLFDFVLTAGTPGDRATVAIAYPGSLPADTRFWKYGPTPDNHALHWYIFPAVIAGNTVVLTITDGGLGDDDLTANGQIVAKGGPGVPRGTVAGSDLNADGKSDIVWRNGITGQDTLWTVNVTTDLAVPPVTGGKALPTFSDTTWHIVCMADFDGDGKADLLWRNGLPGETVSAPVGGNQVWLMDGATRRMVRTLPTMTDLNTQVAGCGDLDGDGKADILWRNATTGVNTVWLMNVTADTKVAVVKQAKLLPAETDATWHVAGVADFDADGKADILWHHGNPGEVADGTNRVWFMNGATRIGVRAFGGYADLNWQLAGAGDFDGDGRADMLWHNGATGGSIVWLLNATTNPAIAVLKTAKSIGGFADTTWRIVGVGDYNGDGKADILWRHGKAGASVPPVAGANQVWLMDGVTRLVVRALYNVTDLNWQPAR